MSIHTLLRILRRPIFVVARRASYKDSTLEIVDITDKLDRAELTARISEFETIILIGFEVKKPKK